MEIIQEIPSFALVQEHCSGKIEVFLKIEITALSYIERLCAQVFSEIYSPKFIKRLFETILK